MEDNLCGVNIRHKNCLLSQSVLTHFKKSFLAFIILSLSITLHSCGDLKTEDTTDKTAPSSSSVSINNGDTTTTSVTLTLSATDDVGVTTYYASETSHKKNRDSDHFIIDKR